MICTKIAFAMFSLTFFMDRQLVFNAEGQVTAKVDICESLEQRMVHDAYYQRDISRETLYRMLPLQATNGHLLYRVDVKDSGAIE